MKFVKETNSSCKHKTLRCRLLQKEDQWHYKLYLKMGRPYMGRIMSIIEPQNLTTRPNQNSTVGPPLYMGSSPYNLVRKQNVESE